MTLADQSLPSSVPALPPSSGGSESNHKRAEAGRVPPHGRPQEQPGHGAEDQTGRPHGQTPQHEAQRVSLQGIRSRKSKVCQKVLRLKPDPSSEPERFCRNVPGLI